MIAVRILLALFDDLTNLAVGAIWRLALLTVILGWPVYFIYEIGRKLS